MMFREKLTYIAQKLGTKPEWLYAVMKHESGLNPRARNSIGCVGLIQFCPETVRSLGYEPETIRQMSATEQLDLVYRYLKPYAPLNSPLKVFLAVFYPAALKHTQKNNYILGSERSMSWARTVRNQNKPFDVDNNGYITINDMRKYVNRYLKKLKIYRLTGWFVGLAALGTIVFLFLPGTIKVEK